MAFSELYMIKFSIVDEGQETKKTTQNLEITTGLLCSDSGQRPVLFEFETDVRMIKKKAEGTLGLCFLITLQNRKFKELVASPGLCN